MNRIKMRASLMACIALFVATDVASAAAIDDIKIETSHERCGGDGSTDENYIVYATNSNSTQTIDANFKYDSNPPHQRFILFDANLNPITDRFPKVHSRRLRPHESATVGCSHTYRAAQTPPTPLRVPLTFTAQTAAYVDANAAEPPPEDARAFTAFILQGDINECGPGAKPPGMLYLVNLHPYARLSISLSPTDTRASRFGAQAIDLPPLGSERIACSNGSLKPKPIAGATLGTGYVTSEPTPPARIVPTEPMAGTQSKIADELFSVFVDLRSSIGIEASAAQFEDPRFYSRAWLEDTISSAMHAAKESDRPGLNRIQDILLTKLSTSMSVESVYGYEIAEASTLRMHVTDDCGRAATYSIQFVFQDGAWRIARTSRDSSNAGKEWFKEGMKATKQFPAIRMRDGSRYLGESNPGTSLEHDVKSHDCSK